MENLPSMAKIFEISSGATIARTVESAASLLAEAAGRSGGRGASGMAAQADALRRRAVRLAAEEAAAYGEARGVLESKPVQTDGAGQARRDHAVGEAVAAAARPPLALAGCAADVGQLAVALRGRVPGELAADVAVAAKLAAGAADAAAHLVEVNLVVGTGSEWAADARERARSAARSAREAAGENDPVVGRNRPRPPS
jgi:formiminotetrahydrofolate cyclodeaminase